MPELLVQYYLFLWYKPCLIGYYRHPLLLLLSPLHNLLVDLDVSSTSYDAVVSDVKLMVDGEEFDDVTVTNGASTTVAATLNFDIDGDLTIEAGEEVTVELMVEFKQLALGNEGITIVADTDGTVNVADGADDLSGSQLSGSATGETHTLRTEGAILEFTSSTQIIKINSDVDLTDDEGVYTLKFEVTAFENDLYIDDSAVRGLTLGTEGANYTITNLGAATTTGVAIATLDSDAELDGSRFKVSEGETETFTLTVEYDPAATGAFKLQLHSLNFAVTNAVPTTQQLALPVEDFDSASLTI